MKALRKATEVQVVKVMKLPKAEMVEVVVMVTSQLYLAVKIITMTPATLHVRTGVTRNSRTAAAINRTFDAILLTPRR